MKRMLLASLSALALVAASSCAPMIENGRDHRNDPKFKKDREERR
jgi:hypothetical protein